MRRRAQGYTDMKDWYARTIAPSLRSSPALAVELQMLRDAEVKLDEEDTLQVLEESPEFEPTSELVPGFPPSDACSRPFLIFDTEPGMKHCCVLRAELDAEAAKTW